MRHRLSRATHAQVDRILAELGTTYLDLLLLHHAKGARVRRSQNEERCSEGRCSEAVAAAVAAILWQRDCGCYAVAAQLQCTAEAAQASPGADISLCCVLLSLACGRAGNSEAERADQWAALVEARAEGKVRESAV